MRATSEVPVKSPRFDLFMATVTFWAVQVLGVHFLGSPYRLVLSCVTTILICGGKGPPP